MIDRRKAAVPSRVPIPLEADDSRVAIRHVEHGIGGRGYPGRLDPNGYGSRYRIIALHFPIKPLESGAVRGEGDVIAIGILHMASVGRRGQERINSLDQYGEIGLIAGRHLAVRNSDGALIGVAGSGAERYGGRDELGGVGHADGRHGYGLLRAHVGGRRIEPAGGNVAGSRR